MPVWRKNRLMPACGSFRINLKTKFSWLSGDSGTLERNLIFGRVIWMHRWRHRKVLHQRQQHLCVNYTCYHSFYFAFWFYLLALSFFVFREWNNGTLFKIYFYIPLVYLSWNLFNMIPTEDYLQMKSRKNSITAN